MTQRVVIAIGGDSLIKDENRREIDDQLAAVRETVGYISDFIQLGYDVVITHGNGPQVGFILRRSELAFEAGELHFVPLKNCVADTQGAIGNLSGVNAVVDKDLTGALMASELEADLLIISTPVEKVYQDFDKPTRRALDRITTAQARDLIAQGQFAPGSILPKIEAALGFIARGGKRVIITTPENFVRAVTENNGTHIVP